VLPGPLEYLGEIWREWGIRAGELGERVEGWGQLLLALPRPRVEARGRQGKDHQLGLRGGGVELAPDPRKEDLGEVGEEGWVWKKLPTRRVSSNESLQRSAEPGCEIARWSRASTTYKGRTSPQATKVSRPSSRARSESTTRLRERMSSFRHRCRTSSKRVAARRAMSAISRRSGEEEGASNQASSAFRISRSRRRSLSEALGSQWR
jgi:hypothetical protein